MSNQTLIVCLSLIAFSSLALSASSHHFRRQASDQQQHQQHQQQHNGMTQSEDGVYVATSSGVLIGSEQQNNSSSAPVYKFLSVPYARAPLGKLRFMRPQELPSNQSDSVVNATKFGPTCAQFRHLSHFVSPLLDVDPEHEISEDCLHLHLYLPGSRITVNPRANFGSARRLVPSDKPVPVIVWFPGEGFDFADARQYDGSHLAAQSESIVIIVQYRVGVFGFLNSPAWNVTGNMGLHDQLMALRWINQNVAAFGGDPDNVTLMGRFSGSMSISSLMTAPKQDLIRQSNGQLLFKRVALISGITVDRWIVDPNQHDRSRVLAETSQQKGLCAHADLDCLQSLPFDQLLKMADYAWRPSIDHEIIGDLRPAEAIKRNQYPSDLESVLLGETATEGTLCLMRHSLTPNTYYSNLLDSGKLTSDDLYDMIRDDSRFYFQYQLPRSNPIQRALEVMASMDLPSSGMDMESNELASDNLRDKYLDACSSYLIKFHSDELKKNLLAMNKLAEVRQDVNRKPVNIYHYQLTYRPSYSLAPDYVQTASHGDDIPLIFGLVFNQAQQNPEDVIMSRKMMQYIKNFAHGHEPQMKDNSRQRTVMNPTRGAGLSSGGSASSSSNTNGSKRLNRVHRSQAEHQKRSWSNEGRLVNIDLVNEKSDEMAAAAAAAMPEARPNLQLVNSKPKSEARFVLVEKLWSAGAPRKSAWTGQVSHSSEGATVEASEWFNLDLSKQPSERDEISQAPNGRFVSNDGVIQHYTRELGAEPEINSRLVLLVCVGAGLCLMLIISSAIAFALLKIQRSLSEAKEILSVASSSGSTDLQDDCQQVVGVDSRRPASRTDLSSVLGDELTGSDKAPFCNMLNKLSNSTRTIPRHTDKGQIFNTNNNNKSAGQVNNSSQLNSRHNH